MINLNLCCSKLIPKAPDFSQPFSITCAASGCGMGAVLLQANKDKVEHPVISPTKKKFNIYQKHCSTMEKETLALLLSLHHFVVYLAN